MTDIAAGAGFGPILGGTDFFQGADGMMSAGWIILGRSPQLWGEVPPTAVNDLSLAKTLSGCEINNLHSFLNR